MDFTIMAQQNETAFSFLDFLSFKVYNTVMQQCIFLVSHLFTFRPYMQLLVSFS